MKNYKFTYVKFILGLNEYKIFTMSLSVYDGIDLFEAFKGYEENVTILSIIPMEESEGFWKKVKAL